MTDSITPPPELVRRLHSRFHAGDTLEDLGAIAFQAGADQELEACCEWTQGYAECGDSLRAARRPKPPSPKEQALTELTRFTTGKTILTNDSVDTIRRALETLPE